LSVILQKVTDDGLQRSRAVGRLVEELESLPIDRAWRVQWEELKSPRSLAQNRYLFGIAYALLSAATGYEKADLHAYLLGRHFGTKLKKVPRTKYNQQGLIEVPVRTTTVNERGDRAVLGKLEFAEYVAFVQRFAMEQANVLIPDPDSAQADRAKKEAA
jgi:hypothetical protein